MAAGMIRSLRPRGKPQSARTCCSNWQTVAASRVRCPELCGRGAISLTSKRPPCRQEELDTKDPDGPQRLGHGQGQRAGLESDDRSHGGRHHRRVQDVPLMVVQADRIGHRVAVLPASHDHRDLGGELDPALGHAGNPAQAGPRGGRLGRLRDQHLPLAVVARAGGFQDQGKTEGLHRRRDLDLGPDRPPGSVRDGVAGQKALLAQPVLADPDGSPSRPDDSPPRQPSQGRGRDILELDGDRLCRGGDGAERRKVIGQHRSPSSGPPGRRVRRRWRSGRPPGSPSAARPGRTSVPIARCR